MPARPFRLILPLACAFAAILSGTAFAADAASRGELIVGFDPAASAEQRSAAIDRAGLSPVAPISGADAVVVSTAAAPRNSIRSVKSQAGVAYVERNFIYRAFATPNDPRFGDLWGLDNNGQTGGTADADIDAPEGWERFGLASFPPTGGVKVGVIDTGIHQDHPDLAGRTADCAGVRSFGVILVAVVVGSDPTIEPGRCADDNGHGSHVAGTIAARADNGTGVTGAAFNSPLAICKALNSAGAGTLAMVANCIDWTAAQGAKVISMSLGGPGSETLARAVRNASESGALLIAAAGNSGGTGHEYPASYPEVVSVAATDHDDQRASFSTRNDQVEIAAPGVDILSTWNDGGYRTISGTSMATPHVSAVAALVAAASPAIGPTGWRARLTETADELGQPGRDPQFGHGRVNLAAAAP